FNVFLKVGGRVMKMVTDGLPGILQKCLLEQVRYVLRVARGNLQAEVQCQLLKHGRLPDRLGLKPQLEHYAHAAEVNMRMDVMVGKAPAHVTCLARNARSQGSL